MTGNHRNFDREWLEDAVHEMRGQNGVDAAELSLFEWYAEENEKIINQMLSVEKDFVKQQIDAGHDCVNDSGILAVEYYIKRARYASIIYMTSLLETYLLHACNRFTSILGNQNIHFKPNELTGDKWTRRKKFLERYSGFTFPKEVWSDLQRLILIRNILVHDNGNLDCISNTDRSQIKNYTGISITQHELVIEKEYVDKCFSAFRSLVDFVSVHLDQSIDRTLRLQSIPQP